MCTSPKVSKPKPVPAHKPQPPRDSNDGVTIGSRKGQDDKKSRRGKGTGQLRIGLNGPAGSGPSGGVNLPGGR